MSYTVPRVAATVALAGLIWYTYPSFLWVQKPKSLDPEFIAEAKRIGNVAVSLININIMTLETASEFLLAIDGFLTCHTCAATHERSPRLPQPVLKSHPRLYLWP